MKFIQSLRLIKADQVVIGHTPEALSFALKNNIPVFYTNEQEPRLFSQRFAPWAESHLALSIAGKVPLQAAQTLSIRPGALEGRSQQGFFFDVVFKEAFVFCPEDLTDFPFETKKSDEITVMDEFKIKKEGGLRNFSIPPVKRKVARQIIFLSQNLRPRKLRYDRVFSISLMNHEKLGSHEFDEVAVRRTILKSMDRQGYVGAKNGFLGGQRKRKKIALEHLKRTYFQRTEYLPYKEDGIIIPKGAFIERILTARDLTLLDVHGIDEEEGTCDFFNLQG